MDNLIDDKEKAFDIESALRVGVVTSAHGIKGEVNVFSTTDDINRFTKLKKVYIGRNGKFRPYTVISVKFFKGTVILGFEEVPDRNTSEAMKGMDILIDRSDAVPLGEDEYFICDIIGYSVESDDGVMRGELKDVLQTGANDVYVVGMADGREILIPSIKDCILKVDTEAKRIIVHLLKGMLDE